VKELSALMKHTFISEKKQARASNTVVWFR